MPVGMPQVAVVCATLVSFAAFGVLIPDGPSEPNSANEGAGPINLDPPSDGQPVLKFRVGDRFTYRNETFDADFVLIVSDPVFAAAANLTKVLTLPMLLHVTAPGVDGWEAYLMDLATGDLVVSPDACLIDANLSCNDFPGFRWGCPLDGYPGIANYITTNDLSKSVILLQDPVTARQFSYRVEEVVGGVRFVEEPYGQGLLCGQHMDVTVNLDLGIVTAMTIRPQTGGVNLTLVNWTRGQGPVLTFDDHPSEASIYLPPVTPRPEIYPPGAERVGPPEWTVGNAINEARGLHAPFSLWLDSHPQAFLYKADFAKTWSDTLGILRTDTLWWTFDILSPGSDPSATMIELVAQYEIVQGQELIGIPQFQMKEVPVPTKVPPGFRPPSDKGVHVSAFVGAMAQRGFDPAKNETVNPLLETGFDENGLGAFSYFLILDSEKTTAESGLLIGFTLISDTGRLGAGSLPLERAHELIG